MNKLIHRTACVLLLVLGFSACHSHDEMLINKTRAEMHAVVSLLQALDAKQIVYLKSNISPTDDQVPLGIILTALNPIVPTMIESLDWLADGDGWEGAYLFYFHPSNRQEALQIKICSSGPDRKHLTKDDISHEELFSLPEK